MRYLTPGRACVLLAVLALAIYANTLAHGYAFDDGLVISMNAFTTQGLAGLPDIFTQDAFVGALGDQNLVAGGRYRPLSVATFALEWQLFGELPWVGHLVNVALYALSSVLLFKLCHSYLLPGKTLASFLVALIFTVHPIHTEVVANIKSRDELMALLFLLLQLGLLFRSLRTGPAAYVGSLAMYALALFSKETAVTFVAIVGMALWCFTELPLKRVLLRTLPFVLVALAFMGLRYGLVGLDTAPRANILNNPYADASGLVEASSIVFVLGKYLWLLFWPATLIYDYTYDHIALRGPGDPLVWLSFLTYAGMGVALAVGLRRRRPWAFGIGVYLATLSIVSNVVVNIGAPMGERLAYLPSLGFALLVGAGLARLAECRAPAWRRPLALTLAAVILVAGSARTIARNADWKDTETLSLADVERAPRNGKVQMGAAETWMRIAQAEEDPAARAAGHARAQLHVTEALEILPSYSEALYLQLLLHIYRDEAELVAPAIAAVRNTARSLLAAGQARDALLESLYQASRRARREQRLADARIFLTQLLTLEARHARAAASMGAIHALRGRLDLAAEAYEHALDIDPSIAALWTALGGARFELGQHDAAQRAWREALKLDPDQRAAREGMARFGSAPGGG